MDRNFTAPITYFLQEGRDNLHECLGIAFEAARAHGIQKIVIFTARGEGVRLAIETYSNKPEYEHIRPVAVTFPQGKHFTSQDAEASSVEIPEELADLFAKNHIPVIRAHLPFDPIQSPLHRRALLGEDLCLVGDALSMFGGSMSLCVQAIAVACDAQAVGVGEHVIAMTSDTAILAQATCTRKLLSEFVIREILCKPVVFSIGRKESAERLPKGPPEAIPATKAIEEGKPEDK